MNDRENKFDYGELLSPPPGYALTKAIGTTYSLDLKTLVSIPVSFHFGASLDPQLVKDPFTLFLSLKDTAEKIDVFCQLGGIHANVKNEKLFRFVERCVNEINLPNNKAFHPKIWVVRYDMVGGPAFYRVVVLSRNLTFDQSWDMIVALEGTVNSSPFRVDSTTNRPIADFLRYLYKTVDRPTPEKFIRDMLKITFRPTDNDDFSGVKFIPMGIEGYRKHIPFVHTNYENDRWAEILIVSPFVADTLLKVIRKNSSYLELISREDTLRCLDQKTLKSFACYHINDKIANGSSRRETEDETQRMEDSSEEMLSTDLHAKIYLLTYKNEYEIWIGSPNATFSAFNGNVEFMVCLKGSSRNAIDQFKELYFNETKDFLVKYLPDLTMKPPKESEVEKLVQKSMCKFFAQLHLIRTEAIPQTDTSYILSLNIDKKFASSKGITISLRPLHLPTSQNKIIGSGSGEIVFDMIDRADLSVFFVVTARHDADGLELSCIIKLPVDNLPANREEWVVKSLFNNKHDFFKLLRLLLFEHPADALFDIEDKGADNGHSTWRFPAGIEVPLFEVMLKAASRDPQKLAEIKKIMDYLRLDEGGVSWHSDGDVKQFFDMWLHFEQYLPTTISHHEAD